MATTDLNKKKTYTFTQKTGIVFIIGGVITILLEVLLNFKSPSSIIAIAFFITMLGFAMTFPSMLQESCRQNAPVNTPDNTGTGSESSPTADPDNRNYSTMRIVVFMMVNVICVLLIKFGWESQTLAGIGVDGWWFGIISFIFGAKATQAYIEKLKIGQK